MSIRTLCSITALLFMLALPAAVASAQQPSPDMTMHRQGAGELDATGWTAAESTQGGFSVRLPIMFNDFTIEETQPDSPILRMFTVGGTSTEGIKFLATRIVYRDNDSAKAYFARIASGEAFSFKVTSLESHEFEGRKSVDVFAETDQTLGHMRFVLLEGESILLSVEIPVAQKSLVPEQMIATYFDSLDVSRP